MARAARGRRGGLPDLPHGDEDRKRLGPLHELRNDIELAAGPPRRRPPSTGAGPAAPAARGPGLRPRPGRKPLPVETGPPSIEIAVEHLCHAEMTSRLAARGRGPASRGRSRVALPVAPRCQAARTALTRWPAPPRLERCRPSSRGEVGETTGPSRKVRTPQGKGGRGTDPGKPAGKCHRKTPPKHGTAREFRAGKGEMVR
jgi:hypothetical protein